MIERLLEIRQLLFETAEALYGEVFIAHDSFWGSVTDTQLRENTLELIALGHEFEEPSEAEKDLAKKVAKKLGLDLDLED